MNRSSALLATVIGHLVLAAAAQSSAQTTVIEPVALTGDPVPDSTHSIFRVGVPAIDSTGNVVFSASLSGGGSNRVLLQTVAFGTKLIRLPDYAPGFLNDEGDPCYNFTSGARMLYTAGTVALSGFIGSSGGGVPRRRNYERAQPERLKPRRAGGSVFDTTGVPRVRASFV